MWDKLDEMMVAGMLTGITILAMYTGYDHNVVAISVTGLVALVGKLASEGKKEK